MPENARQKRVALYISSMHGGGAERVMLDVATGLTERGMSVDLVLREAKGPYLDLVPKDVRIIDLNSHRIAASFPKLLRYIWRERPIALLSSLHTSNVPALTAKLLSGGTLRVVVRQENTFTEQFKTTKFKDRQTLRVLKWLLPLADGIVAVSQGVADDLRQVVHNASHKVTTIYNPVIWPDHAEKASARIEHPWFNDERPPVILSAGRLVPQKDHATLLKAFTEILHSRPARLVILGVGPERDNLLAMAERLGVSQHVDLLGFKLNPFAYMSKSSVFVLSSRYEGFGNVLVEAMACGTPVVSTDCRTGPREILQNGKWGPLVPVGDWRSMAKAILAILDNAIPASRLISRASNYSAEASIDRHVEVLIGKCT